MASGNDQIQIENNIQEIYVDEPRTWWNKYYKYVLIIGLLVVVAIIAVAVALTVGGDAAERSFTFDEVVSGELQTTQVDGKWMADGSFVYLDSKEVLQILKYDPSTRREEVLIPTTNKVFLTMTNYDVSPDGRFVLVSEGQRYYAIDVSTQQEYNISVGAEREDLRLATWTTFGNALVFSHSDNLYYKQSVTAAAVRITSDGSAKLRNGFADWVYDEEIFNYDKVLWFSPNGKYLAFLQFDDSAVHEVPLSFYGEPGALESQYVDVRHLEYPKTGTPNPTVKLFTVDLDNLDRITQISAPLEMPVINGVTWRDNLNLVAVWSNRVQNRIHIQTCAYDNTNCRTIMSAEHPTGWFEPNQPLVFNEDTSQVAFVHSQPQGAAGAFSHVTIFSVVNGTQTAVTTGRFNVQQILKWDHQSNVIFFVGNTEADSHHSQLYAVRPFALEAAQCLTCRLTENGVLQTNFDPLFSAAGNHVLINIRGPSVPVSHIFSWSVNAQGVISLTQLKTVVSNDYIRKQMAAIAEPIIEHLDLPLETAGLSARVKLMRPRNADLSGNTKYPLLVHVYGGPNVYYGSGEWSVGWDNYLSSNASVVIAFIDGRGSGRRGDASLHSVYRNLGTVEIDDQLAATEALTKQLNYIDANRVAMFGWSYGGYATLMTLARDRKNIFRCGASVAPVTDWLYYDTLYTERYMGLPTENERGYAESSLLNKAEMLRNKTMFLVHGTLDDNVHYQQSMELARTLERADVIFEQMSYPDEDHSLYGVRPYLYHQLNRFLGKCFEIVL